MEHIKKKRTNHGRRPMIAKVCGRCGVEFMARAYDVRKGGGRYCSRRCIAKGTSVRVEGPRLRASFRPSQEKKASYRRRENERYPEKRAARRTVSKMIGRGWLTPKPCERCGTMPTHAHHEDYERRLDVVWLCIAHHAERHKEIAEERAGIAKADG